MPSIFIRKQNLHPKLKSFYSPNCVILTLCVKSIWDFLYQVFFGWCRIYLLKMIDLLVQFFEKKWASTSWSCVSDQLFFFVFFNYISLLFLSHYLRYLQNILWLFLSVFSEKIYVPISILKMKVNFSWIKLQNLVILVI